MIKTSEDFTAIQTLDLPRKITSYEVSNQLTKKFKMLGKELADRIAKHIIDNYDIEVSMKNLSKGIAIGARLRNKKTGISNIVI